MSTNQGRAWCEVCGEEMPLDGQWRCKQCMARAEITESLRHCGLIQPVVDETPVARPLHREVVVRLIDERDAARREAIALREALEKARALNAVRYKIIHEAAQHVDVANLSEGLLPAAVEQAVRGWEIALEKLMAAHRALEAAGDLIVRGPAGDTVAAKITALVAILRAALAERDELRALVAADTAKMLEMMGRRS